ncbi:hypothetical protein CAC42_5113 [Sphaceloma murrayae]|uniref:Uncharacterized protein n=1 Tax=Sphaceloma murrayae TaxID=2082308 RepID=A0A2K1QU26_9PEZI|nr:hypothetical protein CAC42_5113 [Sphaceloma murrayae]
METLYIRSDCPRGFNFYSCGNGFRGCCSVEPCNPNSTCPEDKEAPVSRTTIRTATRPSSSSSTRAPPATSSTIRTTAPPPSSSEVGDSSETTSRSSSRNASAARTSSPTVSTTSNASASSTATSASGSTISTTGTTTSPSPVSTATSLPETASATSAPATSSPNKGLIAGSTVGGVIFLLLLLTLMAIILIRRRKRANQMHQATLARRSEMQPMETDDKNGTFAPFGGFYRGVKTFYQPADQAHSIEPSTATPSSPFTPSARSYRVVNADPTPTSPRHPSTIPSLNSEPLQLDSRDLTPLIEMPDTSPTAGNRHSRGSHTWGVPPGENLHADSPTLGMLKPSVYKPYRPVSDGTGTATMTGQLPASSSPGMAAHNRASSASAWVEIRNDTGNSGAVGGDGAARPTGAQHQHHVRSWNEHTAGRAVESPAGFSPTGMGETVSPIERDGLLDGKPKWEGRNGGEC